ncbi:MAG: 50S ribosomal protein L34e [Nanoarchaeota archaeon]
MYKSGRFRRVYVKTPGGRTALHYRESKPTRAHCGQCGRALAGVPRERPVILRRIPKSSRRPERPYGGVLCSACMRLLFQAKARSAGNEGEMGGGSGT